MVINPYILFPGNCEEAMNFYREALGGEITGLSRFERSPMAQEGVDPQQILHGEMKIGDSMIMFSDGPGHTISTGNNVQISINFTEPAVLDNRFAKLSEGGTATFEPQDTFWGARFAMVKDKFGINWMLNCQLNQPPKPTEGMSNIETVIN